MAPPDEPPPAGPQGQPPAEPLPQSPSRARQVSVGINGWQKVSWGPGDGAEAEQAPQTAELPVIVLYTSRLMDLLGVRQLFQATVQQLVPPALQDSIPCLRLAWRLRGPLKPLVLNARALIERAACGTEGFCECAAYPEVFRTVQHGGLQHICTRDLNSLGQSPTARQLAGVLGKGLNHIPLSPWDWTEAAEAVTDGLSACLGQLSSRFGVLPGWSQTDLGNTASRAVADWLGIRQGVLERLGMKRS